VPVAALTLEDAGVRALSDAVAGAQIVGLGEVTHGSHEDALLKSLVTLDLVTRHGFRRVNLEANRQGGAALDRWIQGEGSESAAAALVAARVFKLYKVEALVPLLEGLRAFNATNPAGGPVRLYGIDCQDAFVDAAEALAVLTARDPARAAALAPALAPFVTEERRAAHFGTLVRTLTTAELAAGKAAAEPLEAALAALGEAEAAYVARVAWQGFDAMAHDGVDADPSKATIDYYSLRDIRMGENTLFRNGGEKGVFLGHNTHVAALAPEVPGMGVYRTSGSVLRDRLGEGYLSMMAEFAVAEFRAFPAEAAEPPTPTSVPVLIRRDRSPGTLGTLLGEAAPGAWWVDWRARPQTPGFQTWETTPIPTDWQGASATAKYEATGGPALPPSPFWDILVQFETLTPSRPIGGVWGGQIEG
jgi:erythromycin esterase